MCPVLTFNGLWFHRYRSLKIVFFQSFDNHCLRILSQSIFPKLHDAISPKKKGEIFICDTSSKHGTTISCHHSDSILQSVASPPRKKIGHPQIGLDRASSKTPNYREEDEKKGFLLECGSQPCVCSNCTWNIDLCWSGRANGSADDDLLGTWPRNVLLEQIVVTLQRWASISFLWIEISNRFMTDEQRWAMQLELIWTSHKIKVFR